MPAAPTDRDTLVNRQLPEMSLSDGSETSLRPPMKAMPSDLPQDKRALRRFAVDGNAVITGGTGTLALEGARALLEHGASGLALWDVNVSRPSPGLEQLRADFPSVKIITQRVNVTDAESVSNGLEETVKSLGSIEVLCCFAGVVACTPTVDVSPEEWRLTIDINTTGGFIVAQAVGRQMITQGHGGSIVFIASVSGYGVNFPQPQLAYNTSKAAVLHMSRSLAAEWSVHGIRVNTVSPGYMDTILNEGDGLERARQAWTSRNPTGRMGSPVELTGALVLLCSSYGGNYITGTDIRVDGGQCLLF